MVITDTKTIVDFLRGKDCDHIGRMYDDMLSLNDVEMERCHDQIQFLFPLHEISKHAHTYPVITPDTLKELIKYPEVVNNILRAKDRLEKFLGIGDYEDVDKQRKWCRDRNHNLLRITRAIRCLRLFGLEDEAKDFYVKVYHVGYRFGISDLTLRYWDKALLNDVWESLQD